MSVPVPPWRTAPRTAPLRRPLSQEAIVEAAIGLLDADGVEGVSMRRVAEALGTGPASLYAHVSGKEELLALLLDRALGEVAVPTGTGDWRERLTDLLRGLHRALRAHRDIALVGLGDIPTGPHALRLAEAIFALLREGGLPDQAVAWGMDRLWQNTIADAYEGALFTAQGGAPKRGTPDEQALRGYFASLPAERFPNLVALIPALLTGGEDERFEFGLALLIDGLAAQASPRP